MTGTAARAGLVAALAAALAAAAVAAAGAGGVTRAQAVQVSGLSEILGRPTARSVALSVLAPSALEAYAEWGTVPGKVAGRSAAASAPAATPFVLALTGLKANTAYWYRLRARAPGAAAWATGTAHAFRTQRAPGSTFTFAIQGDSHPERVGKMFDATLYAQSLRGVAADKPDFDLLLGDDFSTDPLITKGDLSQDTVNQLYATQRGWLATVGASAPLFLVNGNHENAALSLLDGTATSPAVLAGNARNAFFPQPAPDAFYTGDATQVPGVGLPRDYYAFTWGDALFVVIDFYWHSTVTVDSAPGGQGGGGGGGGGQGGGGKKGQARTTQASTAADAADADEAKDRDMWSVTLGDAQYAWLKRTLETSKARWKFVFAHHVLGTGRGGVEEAGLYEWGGKDPSGADLFAQKRPGWALPIHQLMAKNGVTIFFQGHDHVYAHQELDGVVYQEAPCPADPTYTAFNSDAYRTGTVLPDSGHLRVTVSPAAVKVDYVRATLPGDEAKGGKDGSVAATYTVAAAG